MRFGNRLAVGTVVAEKGDGSEIPTVAELMQLLARVGERFSDIDKLLVRVGERLDFIVAEREADNAAARERQEAADKRQEAADKRQEAADKRQEAANRQLQVTREELQATGRYVRELGKQIGGVSNRCGDIAEYLVVGDFLNIVRQHFGIVIERSIRGLNGKYQGRHWEVDAFATNDDVVIIGEVKLTLTADDIDKFVNGNLSCFHLYFPEHHAHKKIYGVIAFVQVPRKGDEDDLIRYAHDRGLLVVKAIDNTFRLVTPPGYRLKDYGTANR